MKTTKPTLLFLIASFYLNFATAQEKNGLNNIENQLNTLEMVSQNPNQDNTSPNALENDGASMRSVPITFTYNGSWSPSNPIGLATSLDTVIIESGSLSITTNTICDNFIVNPGATVTIDAGVTLTAALVDLNSTSALYSGLILNGNIVGVVNYHRYTSQIGTNDLIASPVSSELFLAFATVNTGNLAASGNIRAFAPYNTTIGEYQNYNIVTHAITEIESGKGYRAATIAGSSLTFTGTVRSDDVLDIPILDTAPGGGWNLVGNPYPSYIDFNAFFTHNKDQFDLVSYQAIYGYDGDATNGWTIWNQAAIDSPVHKELIAPGQAFYVKAKSGGGQIDFTTAMRCMGDSDDFIAGRNAESPHYGYLKLGSNTSNSSYSTDLYFNTNTTQGFDLGYDTTLYESTPPPFSIYSQLISNTTTTPFAIQSTHPDDMLNTVVPLGVNAYQGQELTISILDTDMPTNVDVYLEDNVNNTITLLSDMDYVFTPTTDLSGTGRFFLSFGTDTLTTEESELDSLEIYVNRNNDVIVVSGPLNSDTNANLYDVNGRLVNTFNLNDRTNRTLDVSQLSAGIYVLELNNDTNLKRTQKLLIN
ncbi:T9SS type A sorting domain-containing protein [Psychroserpens damuponensis]|uniref:T9SS type A sorting domain-containing protein n=1 Tax=Psychroserpens damuponensis TaxID=943936 RepID=UPI000590E06D|nr:T9SS type A sorting domain-containing protein [Psychroserpens damuponensis]